MVIRMIPDFPGSPVAETPRVPGWGVWAQSLIREELDLTCTQPRIFMAVKTMAWAAKINKYILFFNRDSIEGEN